MDGREVLSEKAIDEKKLEMLKSVGRGRLLHPQSLLRKIGYGVTSSLYAKDTSLVSENTKPLLSVKGLSVHFPLRKGLFRRVFDYVKAVDNINFDIFRGQTLGLVGESGCGKTTTGRAIVRLIEPTQGQVVFDGQEMSTLTNYALRRIRKRLQVIFQDPYSSLNPRWTIESIITEGMVLHGIGRTRKERCQIALDLLAEVGLSDPQLLNRYPHEFSAGQRQRISIARALAVEPELIICDESVSALDVSVQAQVLNLLKDLQQKRKLTYLFISHDLSVVKFMSDMIAVMNKGQIVEFGPSESVYALPRASYTKRLINAIPQDSLEHIKSIQDKRVALASS